MERGGMWWGGGLRVEVGVVLGALGVPLDVQGAVEQEDDLRATRWWDTRRSIRVHPEFLDFFEGIYGDLSTREKSPAFLNEVIGISSGVA